MLLKVILFFCKSHWWSITKRLKASKYILHHARAMFLVTLCQIL